MKTLLRLQIAPVLVVSWLLWCRFMSQDAQSQEPSQLAANAVIAHPQRMLQESRTSAARAVVDSAERRTDVASRGIKLSEWRAFRHAHPRIGLSAEVVLTWVLGLPIPMRDVARSCARSDITAFVLSKVTLSASVTLRSRDMFVDGIECDISDGIPLLGDFCGCLLAELPQVSHVALPDDLPDGDLAEYKGSLFLESLYIN